MAVQTKLFFLLHMCMRLLIFNVNMTKIVERSKHGCITYRKKSQRTPFRWVKSNADLEACFGFLKRTSGDICEACRKALQHYRNNGKTFHHVCVFLKFNFFYLTYTRDVKIKITARKPSFTVNFTKRWIPGKSCINRTFSDIEKRYVNSAFSLCERQENMRWIHCFHALEKPQWTPCFPAHFLSFSRVD